MDAILRTKSAIEVGQLVERPPLDWFIETPEGADPEWPGAQVFEGGRVYARIADWDTCLLDAGSGSADGQCWSPPKSPTGYQLAHQGIDLTCDDGTIVKGANIGGSVNHFNPLSMAAGLAVDYYSNTASRMLKGLYHEDDQGVFFLGQVWPDLSTVDVDHVSGTALSGDWRWRPPLKEYDMAGAQMVNLPGLPIGGAKQKQEFVALSMAAGLQAANPRPLVIRGGMGGAWITTADLEDPALASRVASLMMPTGDLIKARQAALVARVAATSERLGITEPSCGCKH